MQLHAMEDYNNYFQKDMIDLEHLQYISEWRERLWSKMYKDPIFKCIYVLVITKCCKLK